MARADAPPALAIHVRCLADMVRLLGGASARSDVWHHPQLIAARVPRAPDPLANVAVAHTHLTRGALRDLARAYHSAGVRAWSLRVPDPAYAAPQPLTAAGYRRLPDLPAMLLDLADLRTPDAPTLDHVPADVVTLGAVNGLAYPAGNPFAAALARQPPGLALRVYAAHHANAVACVLATLDHAGDCGVHFVATLPSGRGRGLPTRLLATALVDARRRGCRTSSLQATELGAPVYARLGYRTTHMIGSYERRSR